jgi:hypothetical protein
MPSSSSARARSYASSHPRMRISIACAGGCGPILQENRPQRPIILQFHAAKIAKSSCNFRPLCIVHGRQDIDAIAEPGIARRHRHCLRFRDHSISTYRQTHLPSSSDRKHDLAHPRKCMSNARQSFSEAGLTIDVLSG